ncbi:MAG TPA: type I phosphomannose isomerase catalytic subunit [Acidobacteriaceae bacterium]|nr:type I phosphomannose isomerase catalytic subunit [Acidobacteriaceae bacterium]
MTLTAFRLRPWFRPMVWGVRDLAPWYDCKISDHPIGEVWLSGNDCVVDTGPLAGKTLDMVFHERTEELLGAGGAHQERFPLLMKVLFPREKLSVQVHPGDEMARQHGEPHGKTECWYVLEAEPGATVALGLRPGTSLPEVKAAIENKTLENLLQPVPVKKDEMIFVDAGTVHAIFPGVVMLETQQNSDMTYRLYDYGRPRELHLKEGLRAIRLETEAGAVTPIMEPAKGSQSAAGGSEVLVQSKYFRVDRTRLARATMTEKFSLPAGKKSSTVQLVFVGAGAGMLESEGQAPIPLRRGELAVVPACNPEWSFASTAPSEILRAIPE